MTFSANAVGKSLKKLGEDTKTIWIADDHDPLRKVPYPLPESYEKYLGIPYSQIPCPEGCCDNFVEHFQKPFLKPSQNLELNLKLILVLKCIMTEFTMTPLKSHWKELPELGRYSTSTENIPKI